MVEGGKGGQRAARLTPDACRIGRFPKTAHVLRARIRRVLVAQRRGPIASRTAGASNPQHCLQEEPGIFVLAPESVTLPRTNPSCVPIGRPAATFRESPRVLYENHNLPTSIERVQALTR